MDSGDGVVGDVVTSTSSEPRMILMSAGSSLGKIVNRSGYWSIVDGWREYGPGSPAWVCAR
jgi:hypothetical protein